MNTRSEINVFPEHVAIVMDGNGRWAKLRGKPRSKGHLQGVKSAKNVVKACINEGISTLTLFAFSSENWQRPHSEVSLLMELFLSTLSSEQREFSENGVRLRFIGDHSNIPIKVRRIMENTEIQTANNQNLNLIIAVGYGGQWDIKQAVQKIARRIEAGELSIDQIDERSISANLSTVDIALPDLFIRTGGEKRISNFLLWQLAYTELYFTDTLWPDFNAQAFSFALDDYARRQRRYGMTPEQLPVKRVYRA